MQRDHILKKLILNRIEGQGQGQSDPKLVHDTSPSQESPTQQIWDSYILINIGDMPQT